MFKKFLWIALLLAASTQAANPGTSEKGLSSALKPEQQQTEAAILSAEVLTRFHYKPVPLDDAMSEKVFNLYLKSLDPEKFYFTQADIDQLTVFHDKLDNAIKDENLNAPFAIFNRYTLRVSQRLNYARQLLKKGFDFKQRENYYYDREKADWAKSEAEMQTLWRQRVKNDWLRLKLAGKDDKSIVETLDNRYLHSLNSIAKLKSEDAFQIFMNAYTMAIEPHTNYLAPRSAEDFDISMKLSLIGIGAVLTTKDDYTTVRELVPGSPAYLSGQLKVGDRILGVAQGKNGAMTDVQGLRLDDTVALIRGKADTVVELDVLPEGAGPDGKHLRVSLIRKKISLEEQAAKKTILSIVNETETRRIGVISLPAFYQDFEARSKKDPQFKSATRDVARLLREMKAERVDGVLLDLRNNGGGSLDEAIELTGLFVGKGPVVQQRDAKGRVTVANNTDTNVIWDGPLGVLINRNSASASEIVAAAIQDYGRGLIIGERSYGKGTVQSMINLDQLVENKKPKFGELKLTIAQFFRINGGTTQLHGVKPDIAFPTYTDEDSIGESGFDNALPWMQINPARYSPFGTMQDLLPALQQRHDSRIKEDRDFQFLTEDFAEIERLRKDSRISLNETERRTERETRENRLKSREALRKSGKSIYESITGRAVKPEEEKDSFEDDGLQANERDLSNQLALEKERKNAKDVLLDEAVYIVSDQVGLIKNGPRLTAQLKPGIKTIAN